MTTALSGQVVHSTESYVVGQEVCCSSVPDITNCTISVTDFSAQELEESPIPARADVKIQSTQSEENKTSQLFPSSSIWSSISHVLHAANEFCKAHDSFPLLQGAEAVPIAAGAAVPIGQALLTGLGIIGAGLAGAGIRNAFTPQVPILEPVQAQDYKAMPNAQAHTYPAAQAPNIKAPTYPTQAARKRHVTLSSVPEPGSKSTQYQPAFWPDLNRLQTQHTHADSHFNGLHSTAPSPWTSLGVQEIVLSIQQGRPLNQAELNQIRRNLIRDETKNTGGDTHIKSHQNTGTPAVDAGMPDPEDHNDEHGDESKHTEARLKWEIKNPQQADKIVRHEKFGKFYRDPTQKIGNKEIWWTKDTAHHAGTEYKIYVEHGKYYKHIADINKNGWQIFKHKGSIGEWIPKKEFIGVR